jgi:hypothetical protein
LLKTHKIIKIKHNLGVKFAISMSPFHKGFVLNQFANAKNVKGFFSCERNARTPSSLYLHIFKA